MEREKSETNAKARNKKRDRESRIPPNVILYADREMYTAAGKKKQVTKRVLLAIPRYGETNIKSR